MVALLFACWCMAVPKSFVVFLVFKSLCGVANTDDIFTLWLGWAYLTKKVRSPWTCMPIATAFKFRVRYRKWAPEAF
jgi:hypothetical protein